MQNFVWALNALDRRQVDMRWELDSMLSSMYLPTYICCLYLVRQCWEIVTQSVPTHCKPCRQNWPVGTKIGDILPCCRHVADMMPTCCQHVADMLPKFAAKQKKTLHLCGATRTAFFSHEVLQNVIKRIA